MTPALLALMIAGGTSVWIYTKLQNHTGYGNSSAAIKGAVVVFVIAFILVFSIGKMLLHN